MVVRENEIQAEGPRTVLITGASSGIGLACASYLAEQGFMVYGTSRRARKPVEAPGMGEQRGSVPGSVTMLPMDVTSEESVQKGIECILNRHGRLDIVVNNAGMGIAGSVENTSLDEARRQFDVNFFGVLRVCRAVLPSMRQQREGYIVNIGSIGGAIAIPYQAMYSASKFALDGFSEGLRLEVRSQGVRVSVVQPGDYKTAFTANRELAEASHQDTVYRRSFEAALSRMAHDEQSGPAPERVARLVHQIVNSRNPRLRYTTGAIGQRAAVWLKRFLPYSLIEHGLRSYYHLED